MEHSTGSPTAPSASVATLLVSREAHPARLRDFEDALAATVEEAIRFPGHLGITVLKPPRGAPLEYKLLVRFDSQAHLDHWLESAAAKRCYARIAAHEARPARLERATGLEAWFETPLSAATAPVPPRRKIALATWMASFPVITFWSVLLHPWLGDAPLLLRALVLSGLMVVSLTYVVMPWVTKRLARWLYTAL